MSLGEVAWEAYLWLYLKGTVSRDFVLLTGGWIFIQVYNLPTYKICTVISTDSLLRVTEAYFSKDSREDDTYVFPSMYNYGKKTILSFSFFNDFLVFFCGFCFYFLNVYII